MTMTAARIRSRDRAVKTFSKACHVCGKFDSISELHHLVSVSSIRKMLEQAGTKQVACEIRYQVVYLCPNHHALLHYVKRTGGYPTDSNIDDYGKITALLREEDQAMVSCVSDFVIQMTPPLKF